MKLRNMIVVQKHFPIQMNSWGSDKMFCLLMQITCKTNRCVRLRTIGFRYRTSLYKMITITYSKHFLIN